MRRGPQKREIQMNKKWIAAGFAALAATTMWGGAEVKAAFDENLNAYTLDAVVVEADRTKNKFGDTITEQSYYRTGGDVKVITREEIEKRHYVDMTDAIKRIPGVTFSNAGYRGGEYGFNSYNNSMAINGDSRVVVLIDGRRVDNSTSTRFGSSGYSSSKTMVDLNQLLSMEDVDKIEVIKGPGASAYGADATGGVINIITRKGGIENQGTIDISTGSWDHHVYNLSYSGSAGNDKSWKYFLSATRNMSGDSKYKDGLTNTNHTYENTGYREEGANIRIDKDFDDERSLKIWYNHKNGKDGYPITAPDYRYWNQQEWDRIIADTEDGKFGNTVNPGYRNLFVLDGRSGSYNAYRSNDIDVTYTFNKDNGMESFIRYYDQSHHYWGVDRYPDWVLPDGSYVPFPDGPEWDEFIKNYPFDYPLDEPGRVYDEKNRGVQLQLGKSFGIHDVLGSVTFDKAKTYTNRWNRTTKKFTTTNVERKSIYGFIQDKIHITDKWDFTPALRYSHYSNFNRSNTGDVANSSSSNLTPTINTEYAFNDTFSTYLGWTKIYRPIKASDFDATNTLPDGKTKVNAGLKDEEGDAWTFGIRKDFGEDATLAVHYDWTKMSNAITSYSVYDSSIKDFATRILNAKETKKSFNVTWDQQISDKWSLSLGYTHLDDKWEAKDGMTFDPLLTFANGNVNTMINSLRPANHYTMNLSYETGKWYTGLLANWYTGCNTEAFTQKRALVLDWNLNYEVSPELTLYTTVTNLTNEAYENAYSSYNGIGAAPQPGRAFMVGARYKF